MRCTGHLWLFSALLGFGAECSESVPLQVTLHGLYSLSQALVPGGVGGGKL